MTVARATMDFFESQDMARRKTVILTFYMVLAVIFLIIGVYAAVIIALLAFEKSVITLWHPDVFVLVAVIVIMIVLLGIAFKTASLSKGGRSVAEMLGGVPVDPNTNDPDQRRLLNVVEEMAIASGVPVPSVYLLSNEQGINAFAAGLAPGDAVIAVTRGCVEGLTRDELQGVIAHEFSHILNGDMRLNMRLIGIIAGILVIAVIGRVVVRGTSSSGRSRSGGKKGGGALVIVLLAGFILMIVGYIGVLFGKLIKAAVSRQREFLADASAVQFTRNPSGIAGALKKIASHITGSRIHDVHADEASHLFFGNGLAKSFTGLLATHPPIQERIGRIDSYYATEYSRMIRKGSEVDQGVSAEGISSFAGQASLSPEDIQSIVGAPQPEHIAFAAQLVSDLPPQVTEAAREPFGARAVIYCLLLNREEAVRKIQLERFLEKADPAVIRETRQLIPVIDKIDKKFWLVIVDLVIPALKLLSPGQYEEFRNNARHLVNADRKISLFEYTLQRILIRRLDPVYKKIPPQIVKYHVIDQVQVECLMLLSILAWRGSDSGPAAEGSFRRGIAEFNLGGKPAILAREKCGLNALDSSLDRLAAASPQVKKRILMACVACISADSFITVKESEMLRAIADTLDCPIPPIISGKTGQDLTH
ncbi:MAG TPA: M48 family metallopeptidase [Desulfatiglandales bacterium]|nr:M48 family metallopeptidase [Desulfatiglandales bacterium]